MDREKLAREFKALRLKRRWTLDKIALIIGISKGTAWNLEMTSKRPHDLTLAKVYDTFPELGGPGSSQTEGET
jgi:transcriptional regulator with XRE-family HTH domain